VQLETILKSTSNIPENPFDQGEMGFPRVMHIEANLLNSISNIRASEYEIL